MRTLALAVLLLASPALAARGDEEFARAFLKSRAAAEDTKKLERFLALDPAELPKALGKSVAAEQKRLLSPLEEKKEPAAPEVKDDGNSPYGETEIKLARYFLNGDTASAEPSLVEPFLKLEPARLPVKLRAGVTSKQLEIRTLLKLHDTKKRGSILNPVPGCTRESGVKPMSADGVYQGIGFTEIEEDERAEVEKRTLCTEDDMVCQFSLVILVDPAKKKPRRLFLHAKDPLMAIVTAVRGKGGGQTNFFGIGAITCSH